MDSPAYWLLLNWGTYLRYGNRMGLGYPTKAAFWVAPSKDGLPHWVVESKAEAVEEVLRGFRQNHPVEAFSLKLYFMEQLKDRSERAYHIRRRFSMKCGDRKADYVLNDAINRITPQLLTV